MNGSVKRVLDTVLAEFKSGNIPQAVAYSMIQLPEDLPSSQWSLLNRIIMYMSGTHDARGYRQWQKTGRYVKKGSKAFHIVVPFMKKELDKKGNEVEVVHGFGLKPVFRVEDTEGEPLTYESPDFKGLPLMKRAREWGLKVKPISGFDLRCWGAFSPSGKAIRLATKAECVFFHELAHAAHRRIEGHLKSRQDPLQEIIAEFAGQCLCRLVGKSGDRYLGNSFRYIEGYASDLGISPYTACVKVLNKVEKILGLILNGNRGRSRSGSPTGKQKAKQARHPPGQARARM
jgi:hypothetical protein